MTIDPKPQTVLPRLTRFKQSMPLTVHFDGFADARPSGLKRNPRSSLLRVHRLSPFRKFVVSIGVEVETGETYKINSFHREWPTGDAPTRVSRILFTVSSSGLCPKSLTSSLPEACLFTVCKWYCSSVDRRDDCMRRCRPFTLH